MQYVLQPRHVVIAILLPDLVHHGPEEELHDLGPGEQDEERYLHV